MTTSRTIQTVLDGRADRAEREVVRDQCMDAQSRRIPAALSQILSILIVSAAIPLTFGLALIFFLIGYNLESRAQAEIEKPVTVQIRIVESGRTVLSQKASAQDLPDELTFEEQMMISTPARGDSYVCDMKLGRHKRDEVGVETVVSGKLLSRARHFQLTLDRGPRRTIMEFDVPCSAPRQMG